MVSAEMSFLPPSVMGHENLPVSLVMGELGTLENLSCAKASIMEVMGGLRGLP